MATPSFTIGGIPRNYQQLTVSTTAVGLTVPINVNAAVIITETDQCRYRSDGTNPTSTVGMLLQANQSLEVLSREMLTALKFIRSGTSDVTLDIEYYERN